MMTAHQMLARVRDLPPISAAALELTQRLGSNDLDTEPLLRALKQDSVLTAKLLRACNSSAMALKAPVASVEHALLIVGHRQLYQMALALAARGPLGTSLPGYGLAGEAFWRHSLLAATAAEMAVSDGLELGVDAPTAFTIGLLHDIGKLVTNRFLSGPAVTALQQLLAEGCSLAQAEKEVLGADHAEVGAGLLYVWRLPNAIVEAVALHHGPTPLPRAGAAALASLANLAAHRAAGLPGPEEPSGAETMLLEALGWNLEQLQGLAERVAVATEAQELTPTA